MFLVFICLFVIKGFVLDLVIFVFLFGFKDCGFLVDIGIDFIDVIVIGIAFKCFVV